MSPISIGRESAATMYHRCCVTERATIEAALAREESALLAAAAAEEKTAEMQRDGALTGWRMAWQVMIVPCNVTPFRLSVSV